MYRVKNDKRVLRSVSAITEGLFRCLETRNLTDLAISDVARESDVSRATFYRLFDAPEDVLAYVCDQASRKLALRLASIPNNKKRRDVLIMATQYLLDNSPLIEILVRNKRADLLIIPMITDASLYMDDKYPDLTEDEKKYVRASAASFLFSVLIVWSETTQKIPAQELLDLHYRIYGQQG